MDKKKNENKEWHANHGGKYTNFEEKYMQKGGPRKASWMAKKKKLVVLKIQFLRLPQCSFTKILLHAGSPKHQAKIKKGKEIQGIKFYTVTQKKFQKTQKI